MFLLADLHLGVGPSRHFDDHVQDAIVLVGEERDVVKARDDLATVLDVHSVLCRWDFQLEKGLGGIRRVSRENRRSIKLSRRRTKCMWSSDEACAVL